jgi:hypothetical protein
MRLRCGVGRSGQASNHSGGNAIDDENDEMRLGFRIPPSKGVQGDVPLVGLFRPRHPPQPLAAAPFEGGIPRSSGHKTPLEPSVHSPIAQGQVVRGR